MLTVIFLMLIKQYFFKTDSLKMQHAKKYGDNGILKALFLPATFL